MAFKQRSSGPFKMMGSSPVKQIDPLDLGLIDEAKKVKVNKGLPKNFNTSGKDTWVKRSKEILSKSSITPHDKAINRLSTNPKTANLPKKEFDALLDKTSKSFTKPQVVKKGIGRTILKGVGQVAKRFAGPVGGALTAFEVGSWAYKNRKEIGKQAETVKKKRVNNPGDHGRPKW